MKKRAEYKKKAKAVLGGNYGILILAFFLLSVIVNIPMTVMQFFMTRGFFHHFSFLSRNPEGFRSFFRKISVPNSLIWILVYIVVLIITAILSAGLIKMEMRLCDSGRADLGDLFRVFIKRPFRFVLYGLLWMGFVLILMIPGSILLIVGILSDIPFVMALSAPLFLLACLFVLILRLVYAFTVPILLDSPNAGTIEAMRQSRKMMHGYKWKLFVLHLSFIGMDFLILLSWGIASLWVYPYRMCTCLYWYRDLSAKTLPNTGE